MELYVMFMTGELSRVWLSAAATNVQFNLVRNRMTSQSFCRILTPAARSVCPLHAYSQ